MRSLLMLALLGACSLDIDAKPECTIDDDCQYRQAYCVEQVCAPNFFPTGTADVFYVDQVPATLTFDVLANDIDPEGREIKIVEVTRQAGSNGAITKRIDENGHDYVEITLASAPATYLYRVADRFGANFDWIPITIMPLSSEVTLDVEAGTSISLTHVFGSVMQTSTIELITPPMFGQLAGTAPNVTYTPNDDYCGTDTAVYRVQATNGTFDVTITFQVGLKVTGEQATLQFGAPTTVNILANDAPNLEIVTFDQARASLASDGQSLIINPPTTTTTYGVAYTVRDTRGCIGSATLTVDVQFPTKVIVGTGLTGDAFDPVLSADGRYVAFTSADNTLVSGDTNGTSDVFVRDLTTNVTTRVSVASSGTQANEASGSPTMSADGRWIAFVSRATNLVAADTTAVEDIYLHDRTTGATTLVSVSLDNTGSDQPSVTPHISADGTRIVFASSATRLVPSDTNGVLDIFVRTISASSTARISLTSTGAEAPYASYVRPRISGNGRYVVLSSNALLTAEGNGTFVVDIVGNAIDRITPAVGEADIDDAGRFVVVGSTLYDRVVDNETYLGGVSYASVTGDGKYVAHSYQKRVLARGTGAALDVIVDGNGSVVAATPLRRPEITSDGKWIVFATNEWPGAAGRFVIVRVWNRAYAP